MLRSSGISSDHDTNGGALGGSSENGTSANISTVLANGYGTDDVDARFEKNFYAGIVEVDGKPVMMEWTAVGVFPIGAKVESYGKLLCQDSWCSYGKI